LGTKIYVEENTFRLTEHMCQTVLSRRWFREETREKKKNTVLGVARVIVVQGNEACGGERSLGTFKRTCGVWGGMTSTKRP